LPVEPASPRSKYIDSCIRKRLNPRASLILRKNFTKRLCLQHHGIGDEMAILFAEAIVAIPYIEAINIADNNLTDAGLGPIINAIVNMKDLVDLDISYNTIGPVAAYSLANYLASEACPLRRMVLRRADVDDGTRLQVV
jgi:Ran GTPase-activating protein (RanGAP) involved in mRNA processing and transport